MSTVYTRAVQEQVKKRLKDSGWAAVLSETVVKLNSGFWDEWYVDMIVQKHWAQGSFYDLLDALPFIEIHTAIQMGWVLFCRIEVGESPRADALVDVNNQALSLLPMPFAGTFQGGPGDCDGILSWNEPITIGQILADGSEKRKVIDPSKAPLEVGFTKAGRTLMHLAESRRLARWPYSSGYIWLMWTDRADLWRPSSVPYTTPSFFIRNRGLRGKQLGLL